MRQNQPVRGGPSKPKVQLPFEGDAGAETFTKSDAGPPRRAATATDIKCVRFFVALKCPYDEAFKIEGVERCTASLKQVSAKAQTLVNGRDIKLVNLTDIAAAATGPATRCVTRDRVTMQDNEEISLRCDRTAPPRRVAAQNFAFEMEGRQNACVCQSPGIAENLCERGGVGRTGVADRNLKALVQHEHTLTPSCKKRIKTSGPMENKKDAGQMSRV